MFSRTLPSVSAFGKDRANVDVGKEARELVNSTGLGEKMDFPVRSLTLADKKRIEVTRALATKPKLLLLDEVVSGLNDVETQQCVELIQRIRTLGVTIFMIEHVMKFVMGISDRVIVLDHGEKIAEGSPQEMSKNEQVLEAYLGVEQVA